MDWKTLVLALLLYSCLGSIHASYNDTNGKDTVGIVYSLATRGWTATSRFFNRRGHSVEGRRDSNPISTSLPQSLTYYSKESSKHSNESITQPPLSSPVVRRQEEFIKQTPDGLSAQPPIPPPPPPGEGSVKEERSGPVNAFHTLKQREDHRRWRSQFDVDKEEKFMWYAAHSGFGNQVIQLTWALRVAALLNRTLILPPKLTHFAPTIGPGNCARTPTAPHKIRFAAWNHYADLLSKPGYVSMADILNMSIIPPSVARTIDLRLFVSEYCRCSVTPACSGAVCTHVSPSAPSNSRKHHKCLWNCGSMIGGGRPSTYPHWEKQGKLFCVDHNCHDTIWTVGSYPSLQALGSAVGASAPALSPYARESIRQKSPLPEPKQIVNELGPTSPAGRAQVLAFSSFFHPRIGDIDHVMDTRFVTIRDVTYGLPFIQPIMDFAHEFVNGTVLKPFACVQIRTADGFFEAAVNKTYEEARQKLLKVKLRYGKGGLTLPLFVMTDLPLTRWNGTFLADLPSMGFDIFTLQRDISQHQLAAMARNVSADEFGFHTNRVPQNGTDGLSATPIKAMSYGTSEVPLTRRLLTSSEDWGAFSSDPNDFLLFLEEAVCSHANLGIVTTFKSTIGIMMNAMRRASHTGLF